ncbi:hypothetical protein ACOME3_001913 [Neoechinorhynchus agilis]
MCDKMESEEAPVCANAQHYILPFRSELRIRADNGCSVMLKSGMAEIFGAELPVNQLFEFGELTRLAVATFHGCELQVGGLDQDEDDAYISKDIDALKSHLALQRILENDRDAVDAETRSRGPRVVIVGSTGCGKTSLWRTLGNWACRMEREPIAVDLDVARNDFGVPGSISAAQLHYVTLDHLAKTDDNEECSFSLHFGHLHPRSNPELFNQLVTNMAMIVQTRIDAVNERKVSGILVNTCGWVQGRGYDSKVHICKAFEADYVVVISNERLYNRLKDELIENVKVIHVPSSSGVGYVDEIEFAEIMNRRIRRYFCGTLKHQVFPRLLTFKVIKEGDDISEDDVGLKVKLYQYSKRIAINGDHHNVKKEDKLCLEEPSVISAIPYTDSLELLENRTLAVSYAMDPSDCLTETIAGYLAVESVEEDRISVLSPSPGPVPNNLFIVGNIQFIEEIE